MIPSRAEDGSPGTCRHTKEHGDEKADRRAAEQYDAQLALHREVVLTAAFNPCCPARIK
jgi:hypothetical protein